MASHAVLAQRPSVPSRVGSAIYLHRWFFGIILAYVGISAAVAGLYGRAFEFSLSLYSGAFTIVTVAFCVGFLVFHPIYIMLVRRPHRLTATILADWKENYCSFDQVLAAGFVILALPPFISAFTSFKTLIPAIQPFAWDPTLMELDRWLHGGTHPWRLLQPVLGHPYVTSAMNGFYHFWFFLSHGILLWQAFSRRRPLLRLRFLISFLLLWAVAGSLVALALSSAGPVYYGRVTGLEDPYQELFSYLYAASEQSPVWALGVQEMLWDGYLQGGTDFGRGISAMPSLHVGIATLLAFFGWNISRTLGLLLTVNAVIIQIGSVHLGWHYAIDGYIAVPLTWMIWMISKVLANWSLSSTLDSTR